ncbi:MAG: type I-B CRISPR-associated protein Cas5b [Spirochaetota bacterium]|nr:type I-B CRISPR-associated protein Cas5b [Spirochaetota bacterium]
MIVYRVEISAITASFRHPTIITVYHPSLCVPPISTIIGILGSATGKWINPKDYSFGYVFQGKHKFVDLETTYPTSGHLNSKKLMEVGMWFIKREIFFEPKLYLYLKDKSLAKQFKTPHYPLLLGRSSDLAMVTKIKEIQLEKSNNCSLYGTSIPYQSGEKLIAGYLQALPTAFENTFPRKPIDVKPYFLIDEPCPVDGEYYCDPELPDILGLKNKIGIYFYD